MFVCDITNLDKTNKNKIAHLISTKIKLINSLVPAKIGRLILFNLNLSSSLTETSFI